MQIVRRWHASDEPDLEWLGLSVSLTGFLAAAAWLTLGLPWPVCWFHQLTGHPCATCGATRAAVAFLHGDLLGALRWNPLAFAIYCGISVFDAYAFAVLATRGRRLRVSFSEAEKKILGGSAIAILLLNWAYLLGHAAMFNG
jgi:hypothetical protein